MVSSLWRDIDHDHVYWGIMSGVTALPKGFSYRIFLAYSSDVTQVRVKQTYYLILILTDKVGRYGLGIDNSFILNLDAK